MPDFGVDHDIIHTEGALKSAEEIVKHKWEMKKDPETGEYEVASFAANVLPWDQDKNKVQPA